MVITNPIQKKHAGTYVCVARNIYGTVISKEARVKFGCEYNVNIVKTELKTKTIYKKKNPKHFRSLK